MCIEERLKARREPRMLFQEMDDGRRVEQQQRALRELREV
jgi:hypothetical protein